MRLEKLPFEVAGGEGKLSAGLSGESRILLFGQIEA